MTVCFPHGMLIARRRIGKCQHVTIVLQSRKASLSGGYIGKTTRPNNGMSSLYHKIAISMLLQKHYRIVSAGNSLSAQNNRLLLEAEVNNTLLKLPLAITRMEQ
jgi:hypothetical protein